MSFKSVYAFIDSQNLNLGVKSQDWILDWRKFRQYLLYIAVQETKLSSAFYYWIDLLRDSLEQKKTGIRGRSKP